MRKDKCLTLEHIPILYPFSSFCDPVSPVITSNGAGNNAALSVAENTAAITTLTVTDPDGPGPGFALSGDEAGLFQI